VYVLLSTIGEIMKDHIFNILFSEDSLIPMNEPLKIYLPTQIDIRGNPSDKEQFDKELISSIMRLARFGVKIERHNPGKIYLKKYLLFSYGVIFSCIIMIIIDIIMQ